ncbi:Diacetyl reductase [Mycena sanguinolenta]|uniref:Diacetyl reductase n=1 Tax=Mycena sanguinolenta TaxID=230812 RepID=A0A8H6YMP2_9AGAR|nr:Diacetyl reductase [Mycena sanguinolenta]
MNTHHNPRVALVTGAARGIGRAIALRLAADGLDVAVNDLPAQSDFLYTAVAEIQRIGRKAVAVTADVSKEKEVEAMVDTAVSALGRLDVMVANAGVGAGRVVSVMDADIGEWEKRWEINIRGTLLCYKHSARQMVKQGTGGRIIGASSLCGLRGFAGVGGYCISKAAVRSLTQTTALELREYGITVNSYAPGVIETDMTTKEADKEHGPGFTVKNLLKIPEVRTAKPADVAVVVSFLASPDSHFVTGQTISVDDGVHFS